MGAHPLHPLKILNGLIHIATYLKSFALYYRSALFKVNEPSRIYCAIFVEDRNLKMT
jgi:hypothetical protein